MTAKKFYFYRIIIAMILAGVFSASIIANNFIIPLIALVITVIGIYMLKKSVKEVLVDERDYDLAGQSARYAINIFSIVALVIIMFIYYFKKGDETYINIASVLAYGVCSLMIIYAFIFKYLKSDNILKRSRTLLIFVLIIAALVVVVFNLRFFSSEDDWICNNGQWVKHGNPSSPVPAGECK